MPSTRNQAITGQVFPRKRRKKPKSSLFTFMRPRLQYGLFLGHFGAGFFVLNFSNALKYYIIAVLIWGLYKTFRTKNILNTAQLTASYICGVEILLRICQVGVFWEFSKYSVILLLASALIVEGRLFKNKIFFLFIILLIPSTFYSDPNVSGESWREMVATTLSGLVALAVTSMYFQNKNVLLSDFIKILFFMLLGNLTTLGILIKNYYSLENLTFSNSSNFALAGGFGPNQVSTSLGLMVTIFFLSNILNVRLSRTIVLDLIMGAGFLYFAFLTFSRGGVLSAIISCILTMLYIQTQIRSQKGIFRSIFIIVIVSVIGWRIWENINLITEGNITLRYNIFDEEAGHLKLTGRDQIIVSDIKIFAKNPLVGVGAGMATKAREEFLGYKKMAHTEFSRLLAEHGILGLFCLIILISVPLKYLKSKDLDNKLKCILLVSYSFLTMSHSATRQVSPVFLYGLALLNFKKETPLLWVKMLPQKNRNYINPERLRRPVI